MCYSPLLATKVFMLTIIMYLLPIVYSALKDIMVEVALIKSKQIFKELFSSSRKWKDMWLAFHKTQCVDNRSINQIDLGCSVNSNVGFYVLKLFLTNLFRQGLSLIHSSRRRYTFLLNTNGVFLMSFDFPECF